MFTRRIRNKSRNAKLPKGKSNIQTNGTVPSLEEFGSQKYLKHMRYAYDKNSYILSDKEKGNILSDMK